MIRMTFFFVFVFYFFYMSIITVEVQSTVLLLSYLQKCLNFYYFLLSFKSYVYQRVVRLESTFL